MSSVEDARALVLDAPTLHALRARAHGLKPVVWIAAAGASPAVLREADRALTVHELIKMHAALEGRAERTELLASICRALGAAPVQVIGKMLVAYRPRPEPPASDTKPPAGSRPGSPRKARAARKAGAARNPVRRERPARRKPRH